MELDVKADGKSLAVPISDPFRVNLAELVSKVSAFLDSEGVRSADLDIEGLIPKMIKGIAGCEGGCPADAKSLVRNGFRNFQLDYVEGGILTASAQDSAGRPVVLKMFPDF